MEKEIVKDHDYIVKVYLRGDKILEKRVSADNANEARMLVREYYGKPEFLVIPI